VEGFSPRLDKIEKFCDIATGLWLAGEQGNAMVLFDWLAGETRSFEGEYDRSKAWYAISFGLSKCGKYDKALEAAEKFDMYLFSANALGFIALNMLKAGDVRAVPFLNKALEEVRNIPIDQDCIVDKVMALCSIARGFSQSGERQVSRDLLDETLKIAEGSHYSSVTSKSMVSIVKAVIQTGEYVILEKWQNANQSIPNEQLIAMIYAWQNNLANKEGLEDGLLCQLIRSIAWAPCDKGVAYNGVLNIMTFYAKNGHIKEMEDIALKCPALGFDGVLGPLCPKK
jgi:tetratricopeptide (TPR) repeat protein